MARLEKAERGALHWMGLQFHLLYQGHQGFTGRDGSRRCLTRTLLALDALRAKQAAEREGSDARA